MVTDELLVAKGEVSSQKKRMLAKARILFGEKGYYKTTMRDVARACDCEPGNIYNYFPSKEALLYEALHEEAGWLVSSIKHLENDDVASPVEQLRLLIKNHVGLTLGYRRASKLLFDMELKSLSPANQKKIIELRDAYDRILRKIIRRGINSGDFAEIDVKLAGYSIAAMILRTRIWFSPRGRLSVNEVTDFIFNFVLNALRGEKR